MMTDGPETFSLKGESRVQECLLVTFLEVRSDLVGCQRVHSAGGRRGSCLEGS